jgi:HEAT repeat protein
VTDDPAAARQALDDPDGNVRAQAALRLAELDDPYALDALIRTLDDGAGPNHVDITPAVTALGDMGERALPALIEPLGADDELTRLHAQRALEAAIQSRHGGAEDPTRDELTDIGYDYDAEPEARAAAIDRLRRTVSETP